MKINRENVLKVKAIMERVPDKAFDIDWWQLGNDADFYTEKEVLEHCGTTCCISGWVRVSPEFRHMQSKAHKEFSAFVAKKFSKGRGLHIRGMEEASISDLLGIPDRLAYALIYDQDELYVDYKYRRQTTDTKPRHVIKILDDLLTKPEKFKAFES
jgi:hypothetical protein